VALLALLLNTALLCAVLLRRLTAAPIDRYLRPAGPTAANPPQRLAAANGKQTDTQMDTVPDVGSRTH